MTALLFLISLFGASSILPHEAQSNNPQPNTAQALELKTIGNGWVLGRGAAFRTYAARDGTEALVWYGEFRSEEEAKSTTKQWLEEHKITGEERIKDPDGQVVGNRIIAAPKHSGKGFIVIRRHGLNYWFIQSVSLTVAMQVDGLIEPPTHGNK